LHWAAKIGFIPGIRFLLDHAIVDLNQLSETKNLRVIDIAALNDQVEVLKLLVKEYSVDPFMENESGKTALDWAISEHKLNAVEYLKSLHGYKKRSIDNDNENESILKKKIKEN
jgi:ankyrin repeat protein